MESVNENLRVIKEKFPAKEENIEKLYIKNDNFRDLCLDYLLCMRHIEKCRTEIDERNAWLLEYGILRKELENDLTQFIDEQEKNTDFRDKISA